jgi:hypothetical protein
MMFFLYAKGWGQAIIQGNVFDSTKLIPVKGVRGTVPVEAITYTDSTGHYRVWQMRRTYILLLSW